MPIVSGAELARIAGVSRAGITIARNDGRIYQEPSGKYDTENPDNAAYIELQQQKRASKETPKPQPKPKSKKTAQKKAPAKKNTSEKKQQEKKYQIPPPPIDEERRSAGLTQSEQRVILNDLDIRKKTIEIEKLSETVISRDSIQYVWNKIYKSASYFADFGQKYCGEWAAALGISDPGKIVDLQKMVDRDTELFIRDFTETVASEI